MRKVMFVIYVGQNSVELKIYSYKKRVMIFFRNIRSFYLGLKELERSNLLQYYLQHLYVILISKKIEPKFLSVTRMFSLQDTAFYFWKQFLYTAMLLHLLIKLSIYFVFDNVELNLYINLVMFLLCLSLTYIIDIYYYVVTIIGKICYYFLGYIAEINALDFDARSTIVQLDETYTGVATVKGYCDRFYFFRFIFIFLEGLRLFILREPLLFGILHLTFIYFYLSEINLFYSCIYLFIYTNKQVFIFFK